MSLPDFTKPIRAIFWLAVLAIAIILLLWAGRIIIGIGPGAFKRHVTMSGIYSVCHADGYPTLCMLDADSKDGGLSCIAYDGPCK